MPEKVRLKFDDEGNSVNITQVQDQPPSKKRKRNHPQIAPHKDATFQGEQGNPKSTHLSHSEDKSIIRKESINATIKKDQKHGGKPPHQPTETFTNGKSRPPRPDHPRPKSNLRSKSEALQPFRRQLPIWSHADAIRDALRTHDVLLLVGETGSGKSTQVPQFLLGEPWCKGIIAVTEPRRVAAVSLARRVAEEMGSTLGSASPASKVGYSVRFDHSVAPATKLKYLTEGMLLQDMLKDETLDAYSTIVVDEVHERSVNVDLVLGFLRRLVTISKKRRKKKPLKVVVMSATADTQKLKEFFEKGYADMSSSKNGEHSIGENNGLEDDNSSSSWSGLSSDDENPQSNSRGKLPKANGTQKAPRDVAQADQPKNSISLLHIQGRQYPVEIVHLDTPTNDYIETALKTIFQIHHKEPLPGDVLVFLPGQDTIENLESLLNEYAQQMSKDVPKMQILPLFAALPQLAQQRVFQPPPPRTRKIILSTNIAETSVTVPGVRIIVDSGKVKLKHFRNRLGLESLLVHNISQDAAIQRAGRAGREGPGKCFRLYTEDSLKTLIPRNVPEILRCDLSAALLNMKARGVNDVVSFPLVDPPSREALEKALLQLLRLGTLREEDGGISEVGQKVAKLPLAPTLGRVLVEAASPEHDCVLEVIDVIAALSVENVFLTVLSEEKAEAAKEARSELYRREGDHMTLLATVRAYAAENTDRKAWAEKHFCSHRAMQNIMDIRKQLLALCIQMGLLPKGTATSTDSLLSSEQTTAVLQCILRGFALNTARLMPDGSYRTLSGNATVAIHPSSVLFGRKLEAIVFTEFVYTNRSYARGVSAVQLNWVGEALGVGRDE